MRLEIKARVTILLRSLKRRTDGTRARMVHPGEFLEEFIV